VPRSRRVGYRTSQEGQGTVPRSRMAGYRASPSEGRRKVLGLGFRISMAAEPFCYVQGR